MTTPTPTRYGATRARDRRAAREHGRTRVPRDQLWDGLWTARLPLEELTNLSKALRERLADALPLALDVVTVESADRGHDAQVALASSGDDAAPAGRDRADAVPDRATVCVSSQAGCAMGCTFCATGQAGFERHLDAGEIVEQVVRAAHASPQPVGNVVFMGMGEPLANFDAVWAAVERLHGDFGLSARHITVSTVGVVPGIRASPRSRSR